MSEQSLDKSKTKYWQRRSLHSLPEMRRNKETGLFPKSEGWRNVVEHELVEAEAADVLAEKLGLSEETRNTLRVAALLHDVHKRKEIEKARKEGPSGFDESAKEQSLWLKSLNYSREVIDLTESVGHTSFKEFIENFDSIPIAKKIMHYVDDIVLNSDIVPLNIRVNALEENPRYKELNEQGRLVLGGRTYSEVQREISQKIEQEFAPKLGVENPSDIPAFIKKCIEIRISQER